MKTYSDLYLSDCGGNGFKLIAIHQGRAVPRFWGFTSEWRLVISESPTRFFPGAPTQGRTSAALSALISIFPSKGPHVVPTGSCCRLWIRRSPSLRKASSSPENTPEPRAVSHSALYSTQVPHQITVTFSHCPFPSKLRGHQSPAAGCEG